MVVKTKGCEHCGGDLMTDDEDKQVCFQCGRTAEAEHTEVVPGIPGTDEYFTKHSAEILADRLTEGHGKMLATWGIHPNVWLRLKPRWEEQGIEVVNMTTLRVKTSQTRCVSLAEKQLTKAEHGQVTSSLPVYPESNEEWPGEVKATWLMTYGALVKHSNDKVMVAE